ncbi:tyrosinase family protein [Marinovum algicola]|uniref:tyrosinase family protein n=1 Tax=Marinovum algicola TaxID=42444 RepID=UPI0032EB2190
MSDTRTRQNVFDLGDPWAAPILWYARAVKAMKARPLAEPTSWNFFGAIHGIWRDLWDHYGLTDPSEPDPDATLTRTFLNQCQHQSWYFLPWHRGYLLALEEVLRAEIKAQNGPHESWALPYWNYFGEGQNLLPPAFHSPDWPDGTGDNPLFVAQRWGVMGGQTPFDVGSATDLKPMQDPVYTGPGGGVSTGFGGPSTGFNWNGGNNGGCESAPHNTVHGLVGGRDPDGGLFQGGPLLGLMSTPISAALDPVFYLHHCNIDRLWESWNRFPADKPKADLSDFTNPNNLDWLDGPESLGQRGFAMPKPDGSPWPYTPKMMRKLADLGYDYDDLTPGAAAPVLVAAETRMRTLGMAERAGGAGMADRNKSEMVGASDEGLSLSGSAAQRTTVRTDPAARARMADSRDPGTRSAPDRVFLNLENITGLDDATLFHVFLGPAGGDEAAQHKAGTVSLFGVRQASAPDAEHAGSGLNAALEITEIVDLLHLQGGFTAEALSVRLVPLDPVPEAGRIHIGRVSIHRQHE